MMMLDVLQMYHIPLIGVFLLYRTYLLSDVNKSYYVIHHAVPRGGGSRSLLRDTLSSAV